MGKRSGAQAGRWLRVLDRLSQSRAGMTVHELAAEFECAVRTVYRDLEHLQEHFETPLIEEDGRWRVQKESTYQPTTNVEFTPSELLSLLAAGRILAPLQGTAYGEGLASLQAKVRARLTPSAIKFIEADGATLAATADAPLDYRRYTDTIEKLKRAIREHKTVEIRYLSLHSRTDGDRKVDPYRLWFSEGLMYLVGGCHRNAGATRTFAVDRVRDVRMQKEGFEIPPDFRWEEYVRTSFKVFHGEARRVTIDFTPAIAPVIRERRWHASQTLTEIAGGGIRLKMEVAGLFEVTQFILRFGADARAVDPPELVEAIAREVEKLAAVYAVAFAVARTAVKPAGGSPPPAPRARAPSGAPARAASRPATPRAPAPRPPPRAPGPRRKRSPTPRRRAG